MPDGRPGAAPVFLDASGRRRRVVRIVAVLSGCAVLGFGALLTAALLGAPVSPSALFAAPAPTTATTPSSTLESQSPDNAAHSPSQGTSGTPRTAGARVANAAASTTTPTITPTIIPTTTPTTVPTTGAPATTTVAPTTRSTHTAPGRPTDLSAIPPGHTR